MLVKMLGGCRLLDVRTSDNFIFTPVLTTIERYVRCCNPVVVLYTTIHIHDVATTAPLLAEKPFDSL